MASSGELERHTESIPGDLEIAFSIVWNLDDTEGQLDDLKCI